MPRLEHPLTQAQGRDHVHKLYLARLDVAIDTHDFKSELGGYGVYIGATAISLFAAHYINGRLRKSRAIRAAHQESERRAAAQRRADSQSPPIPPPTPDDSQH